MTNQKPSKQELKAMRSLGDFDLTMMISEINDHGWPMAAKTLWMIPDALKILGDK